MSPEEVIGYLREHQVTPTGGPGRRNRAGTRRRNRQDRYRESKLKPRAGRARRAGGKLPPHVMVYFVMALALFADDDYEEVAARLAEALRGWGAGDQAWDPAPGGITQARQRLGPEPENRSILDRPDTRSAQVSPTPAL